MDFSNERLTYQKHTLTKADLPSNPFDLFKIWINEAIGAKVPEAYAFSLATCGADDYPSVRTLLMREITPKGITFYTNYDSDKGQDLAHNPKAEALFFWHDLERQVRIQGIAHRLDESVSTAYFAKRPKESQLGAWVSNPQSGVVENRAVMESRFVELSKQYEGQTVPKPPFWGGYELVAGRIEFWQGRVGRMHDRIVYERSDEGQDWYQQRLLP